MTTLTPEQVTGFGLQLVGVSDNRLDRLGDDTQLDLFNVHFGIDPSTFILVWEDMMHVSVPSKNRRMFPYHFLLGLHFLKCYPTEKEIAARFDLSVRSVRDWVWFVVEKIRMLKEKKVRMCAEVSLRIPSDFHIQIHPALSIKGTHTTFLLCCVYQIAWPVEWSHDAEHSLTPNFLLSVDGVHFKLNEPRRGDKDFNPKFFSHKFGSAGYNYEVGISVFSSKVVWINGPFPAGTSDMKVFKEGLMHMIPVGKRVIGDSGYKGLPDILAVPNSQDSAQLKTFKVRLFHRALSPVCSFSLLTHSVP